MGGRQVCKAAGYSFAGPHIITCVLPSFLSMAASIMRAPCRSQRRPI